MRYAGRGGRTMTEAEWDASADPVPMLALLEAHPRVSARKRKFLLCAVARQVMGELPEGMAQGAHAVEEWIDGPPAQLRQPVTARMDLYDALFDCVESDEQQRAAMHLL